MTIPVAAFPTFQTSVLCLLLDPCDLPSYRHWEQNWLLSPEHQMRRQKPWTRSGEGQASYVGRNGDCLGNKSAPSFSHYPCYLLVYPDQSQGILHGIQIKTVLKFLFPGFHFLQASTAGDASSVPGQGTKILHAKRCSQKKRKNT